MTAPLVVATIVNWNGRDLIMRLLRSLEPMRGNNFRIIVVDNASTDGSVEALEEKYPDVEVISLPRNLGYSAGINAGIRRADELGAKYCWIFNNDVEVEHDALSNLLEAMEADPEIGVAGPLVHDYRTGEIAHTGYHVNLWLGWITEIAHSGTRNKFMSPNAPYEVDSAFGCSNLIRMEIIKDVGFFDPAYNVYFDETDFNLRARQRGWKVVVAPKARVRHEESATMNRRLIHKAWLLLRNLLRFELKNAKAYHLMVFLPYYFLIHIPYFLIRGGYQVWKIKQREGA